MKKQGFEILTASSEGYEPCAEVEECLPDVKAYNRKKEYVVFGLARTCEELANERTEELFKVLAKRYLHGGKSAWVAVPLCIAVTNDCEEQLDAFLVKLLLNRKKNVFRYAF